MTTTSYRVPRLQGAVQWLVPLILVGWFLTTVWSSLAHRQLTRTVGSLASDVSQQSQKIDKALVQLKQQLTSLSRTVETVIPAQVPVGWYDQLAEIKNTILAPNRWPQSQEDAAKFMAKCAALISELPPWAEATFLNDINFVRWGAMAFQLLHLEEDLSWRELDAIVDDMRELVFIAPDEAASLRDALEARYQVSLATVEHLARSEDISRAKQFLNGANEDDDARLIYALLESHEPDTDSARLRHQLHRHILMKESATQVDVLRARWLAIKMLEAEHPAIYEQAVGMLLTEVAMARVALAADGFVQPDFNKLHDELESTIQTWQAAAAEREMRRHSQAFREYQRWAIRQIRAFEEEYDSAEQQARRNSRLYGHTWTTDEYLTVQNAIISHLLPINVSLLELPVQERFMRQFQRGWNRLDGRKEQDHVAEQTVEIEKRTLAGFLEGAQ